MPKALLVGNPNCGKTTLFNLLTGDTQRVGNWSGVTVEKKTGNCFLDDEKSVEITDLPGVYSLCVGESSSQDCKITASEVALNNADLIINVIDACHLERHLYLTTQLLELKKPMIVIMNMMDIAKSRKISIDIELLSKTLQCPVISMQAHKNIGLKELKSELACYKKITSRFKINHPADLQNIINSLKRKLLLNNDFNENLADYHVHRLLEGGEFTIVALQDEKIPQDADILMADNRYTAIHRLVLTVQTKATDFRDNITAKIDKFVLNRFFALPLFIGIMYLMFLFAINIGNAFQDFFDITTSAIFVGGTTKLLSTIHAPNWVVAVLANGVGRGINTTATFIPVIAMMFFFLSMLEISGYMARAAFIIDRLMRILGLPGKAFVPMIVGFGCNVPGIMAARTLDSERDRILTVLMSPFMSCSARLAIYAVFVTAFFPTGGQNIVFSLYLIGILMAVFTGFLLRKTILHGEASPFIIELPAYHRPSLRRLLKETSFRLRHFLIRAGKLIIPICVLLSGLNSWMINTASGELSILAIFGKWITPIFSPMGIGQDNWPAVVGLLTGTLAKEVVIGSLNSLYAKVGHISDLSVIADFNFLGEIKYAFSNLIVKLSGLSESLFNPFAESTNSSDLSQPIYGVMHQCFQNKAAAYSYLLFILLYIPCASTMAAIRQETNSKLMWMSISWSLFVAYTAATIFYQASHWINSVQINLTWCFSGFLVVAVSIGAFYTLKRRSSYVTTTA